MKKIMLMMLALALVFSGCTQNPQRSGTADGDTNTNGQGDAGNAQGVVSGMQVVEAGDTVRVEYVGSFPDGNVFDKSEGRGPLEFTVGEGQMIKGFDNAVIGMKVNEEKNITLAPENAYGPAMQELFIWVPKSQLPQDINVEIGTKLMTQSGTEVPVVDVNADSVKIDFNHPFAGKTLKFWIKVVSLQKAK